MATRPVRGADWMRRRRARRVFTPHIHDDASDVPDLDWLDDVYPALHDDRDDDGEYDDDPRHHNHDDMP